MLRDRFGIARGAALMSFGSLAIDPRKSALAFMRAACANGARIYAPVEIISVSAKKNGVTAVAANRCVVRCRKLIFATGYELPHGVSRRGHKIMSTWAIA